MGFEEDIVAMPIHDSKFGFGIDLDIEVPEKINEYERLQEKMGQERLFKAYMTSGVPEKFWNESFDTFEKNREQEIKIYDEVRSFADNPKNRVLVLCGKNGCGKTHLAASVIRHCGGEYVTSPMLCMMYDSAYKGKMSREELILHYSKIKMLVIDECCKYFLNEETEKFLLMQIICMRYENNKPTVLVTNADKLAFVNFLGRAVYDRFTECCSTLEFDWESRRKERRG